MRTEFLSVAIASPDYRKYIEENHIELSDWDLATLIYHNKRRTHEEIIQALRELAEKTDDGELKKQIQERILQDEEFYELFKQSAENAYFATFHWSAPYARGNIFNSFKNAHESVMKELCPTGISRCKFDDCEDDKGVWGTIEFSPDGHMENYFWLWSGEKKDSINDGDKRRFECRGLDLPLMFRIGDIVYVPHEDAYGIVVAPTDNEDAECMRKFASYEYDNFQVVVDYIYRDGKYQTVFSHGHVSPADLEYGTLREDDEEKGFLEYLAQRIYKKQGLETGACAVQRMDEVLRMIKIIWEQYPDLRLGQLLVNVCGREELFCVEDEELMKALQRNKFPIEGE